MGNDDDDGGLYDEEFYYDDMVAYADQEFPGYVAETIDPSPWTLIGTFVICVLLLLLAVAFLKLRRRRRKRRKKKKAQLELLSQFQASESASQDEKSSIEVQFLTPDFDSLVKKRPVSRIGIRLKGWGDIAQSIEEDEIVRRRWLRSRAHRRKQELVEDILDRDLFESGGVMHQLNKQLMGTTPAPEDSSSPSPDVDADVSGSTEATTNAEEEDTSKSPGDGTDGTDYKLMDDGQEQQSGSGDDEAHVPKSSMAYLLSLFHRDREYKKIIRLAVPYSINSLIASLFELLTLAVVGKMMGTRELSAFILVDYMVTITTMFLEGIMSSLTAVCSQAIGAKMYGLAGQYTQIAIVLYILLFLPQLVLWWSHVDDVMLWMDFEQEAADIAQAYARVYVVSTIFEAVHSAFTYLLDVSGYEKFTTAADCAHSVGFFCLLVAIVAYGQNPVVGGDPSLQTVAYLNLFVDVLFLLGKLLYMRQKQKWWDNYWPGLGRRFALCNFQAVKRFLKTAAPLSVGYILSYGEWEVLFLMASTLGPAEVAAWGLLGEIWSSLEGLTEAWGDAAEVRCARLLGGGNADGAELSSHKSLALGTAGSIFASLLLAACSRHLAGWITTDETLKGMVTELIPFVCVGNVTLAVGSISWQLIGAQTRYSLATAVQFIGSWVVTLPLALLSAVYLNWDLSGLVAAVVIGNMLAGMLNFVILCCTDWERTSNKIMAKNSKIGGQEADGLMQKTESGVSLQNLDKSSSSTSSGMPCTGPVDLDKSFLDMSKRPQGIFRSSAPSSPVTIPTETSSPLKRSKSEDASASAKTGDTPIKRGGSFHRFWRKRSTPSPESFVRVRTPMPAFEIKLDEQNLT